MKGKTYVKRVSEKLNDEKSKEKHVQAIFDGFAFYEWCGFMSICKVIWESK